VVNEISHPYFIHIIDDIKWKKSIASESHYITMRKNISHKNSTNVSLIWVSKSILFRLVFLNLTLQGEEEAWLPAGTT
jgi:hypothetical protein